MFPPVQRNQVWTTRWKIACVIFGVWTVYGFLLGQQIYALRAGTSPTWGRSLGFELAYCYMWALMTPLVWRLRQAFPFEGSRWVSSLPVHIVAALMMAAAAQAGEVLILSSPPIAWFPAPARAGLFRSILNTIDYGAVLYWVVLLVGQLFASLQRHNLDQIQKSELQAQLAEARLQALRMQLNPHFLFNALNSIAELIHCNPRAADKMLARLSELLRIFLRSSERQEVALEEEVDFLERYLEIQQIRFDERLCVDIRLDPRTLHARVPSLILQPLVENAIRHGIGDREEEGFIMIESFLEGGRVSLSVRDSGDGRVGARTSFTPEGTGLRNTRRRLESIYGADYEFRVQEDLHGGVEARINIPFRAAVRQETEACAS